MTTQNSKAKNELEKNRGESWNTGKDLERGQGHSWKQSLLALLCGGPVLHSGVTENSCLPDWLTCISACARARARAQLIIHRKVSSKLYADWIIEKHSITVRVVVQLHWFWCSVHLRCFPFKKENRCLSSPFLCSLCTEYQTVFGG